ncbi:hypothetical protein PR048_001577 [Dryococelus australis]|uniref:DDE-1 domain-containing protein n=1 Tax=Dryococelus australis TaxID=614101 RepID=A0ABQ9IHX2_9NEOP|nr:hypothetical protein PR048_001577 [Dryococelus australis]
MRERKTQCQSWDLQGMQAAVDAVSSRHLTPSAASKGFDLTISEVDTVAYKLSLKEELKFYAFKKRHPNLSVRKPEAPSLARARGMNKADVTNIFEMFENLLNINNLIHNADETGFQLNNRPEKILSMKGKRNAMSVTAKERGETVAVLTCVSATGVFLPPFLIFKGKNMKQEFRDNLLPGSVVFMSDSGYITIEIFRKKTNLLVLDGHSTHVSDPDILQFAVDNYIIMISLPPQTPHYIQPHDRSFFRYLKMHYHGACNRWINITKLQFGMLLSQAWGKACSVENSVSGFRAYGLVPFNPGAIPKSAFSPSECFQMAETETPAEGHIVHFKQQMQSLCPTPRILQKMSSSRCQKAAILTSPEHIKKMKENKDINTVKPKKEKLKRVQRTHF